MNTQSASGFPNKAYYSTIATPDGPFSIIVASDFSNNPGAVLASGWTEDIDALRVLIHPTLRPAQLISADRASQSGVLTILGQAVAAVKAYYAGDYNAPRQIPVLQCSGDFRQRAWEVLRGIKPGEPVTYRELAARCGNPSAVRAAAGACASNTVALFVPCHRVLRSDGSMGGFRYGIDLKLALLKRENAPDKGDYTSGNPLSS